MLSCVDAKDENSAAVAVAKPSRDILRGTEARAIYLSTDFIY